MVTAAQSNPIAEYEIDLHSGRLRNVMFYPSPHFNERPVANDISLLVIHDTEIVAPDELPYEQAMVHYLFTYQYELMREEYPAECLQKFPTGQIGDVSAHLVIRRSGEVIQYVPFTQRAWHAGVSEFEGRESCNDFSIGIELEGYANRPDYLYTDIQYEVLAKLSCALMRAYPQITLERIVGHDAIARPLFRKTDPGLTFDWQRYFDLIGKFS